MSSKVIVSIGCNAQHEMQMQYVRECLKKAFPDARFTDSMLSTDIKGSESKYCNLLAEFSTVISEAKLNSILKQMESDLGNTKELRLKGIVMMDIDILKYDEEKHHTEDWSSPYIRTLLKRLIIVIFTLSTIGTQLSTLFAQTNDDAKSLLTKAIEYYTGQKYHECILTFKELQKKYRLNARYTAYLGYSYYKTAEYKDAIKYLESGIPQLQEYSPFEQASYIYACAESYFNIQEYKDAIPWYLKALSLVNGIDKGDIYYHTGFSYYMLRNNHEAYNNLFKADSIYTDSIYGASLDKQHIARKTQTKIMLKALH